VHGMQKVRGSNDRICRIPVRVKAPKPRAKAIGLGAFFVFVAEDAVHDGRLTPDRGGACTWPSHWLEWLPSRRSRGCGARPLTFHDDARAGRRAWSGDRAAAEARHVLCDA